MLSLSFYFFVVAVATYDKYSLQRIKGSGIGGRGKSKNGEENGLFCSMNSDDLTSTFVSLCLIWLISAPYDFLMLQLTWPSGYCLSMADASCSRYLNQSMNNFTIRK